MEKKYFNDIIHNEHLSHLNKINLFYSRKDVTKFIYYEFIHKYVPNKYTFARSSDDVDEFIRKIGRKSKKNIKYCIAEFLYLLHNHLNFLCCENRMNHVELSHEISISQCINLYSKYTVLDPLRMVIHTKIKSQIYDKNIWKIIKIFLYGDKNYKICGKPKYESLFLQNDFIHHQFNSYEIVYQYEIKISCDKFYYYIFVSKIYANSMIVYLTSGKDYNISLYYLNDNIIKHLIRDDRYANVDMYMDISDWLIYKIS